MTFDGLKDLLRVVVGDIRWAPPTWVHRSADKGMQAVGLVRAHPRRSAWILTACLAIALVSVLGWRWYQALPKPLEYSVSVSAPERTCIECDPPGKPNAVTLWFSGSVAPLEAAGKTIDPATAGVSIRPEIAGEWRWQDDRSLTFTPAAEWPLGKNYTVEFKRQGFVAPQVRLDTYSVEFSSPVFSAAIESNEFYQDPVVAAEKKVVTSLQFTQPVDAESLEERISVKLLAKVTDTREEEVSPAPSYTLTYDKLRLHAYVHTSSLAVLPKGGRVVVAVEKGVQASVGSNETPQELSISVAVPGLYSLAVTNLDATIARDERDVPSQALVLETSHSVEEPEMTGHVRAWLLPLAHPDPKLQQDQVGNRRRPFYWSSQLVTPAILESAQALQLSYVPNERDHVELHSFKFTAEPGRQFYVQVDQGLKSFGGYLMAEARGSVVAAPEYPKEVHIASQGALLALSGPKKLVYVTRDVPAVRVQVGRLLPDQLQHLITQTNGSFSQPVFSRYGFDASNVTERFEDVIRLPAMTPGAANYQTLDLAHYLDKPGAGRQGIFLLRIEAWDAQENRPIGGGEGGSTVDTRLVVVTDLGMIAKHSVDGTQDVFVQSIATGEPVRGATVQVVGRNGQPTLTEVSDDEGHVRFSDTRDHRAEREPVMYLARREGDSSFLPIRSQVGDLDLSRFDVGGVSNRAEQAALSAYLFSDRGIYRPGDEIRAAAIVKALDWRKMATGLPLRVVITDPRGQVVKRELMRLGGSGFEEIRYTTRVAGAVGNYTISLYLVRPDRGDAMIGTLDVKVQEFLPDRLRMTTRFSKEQPVGWVTPEELKAEIALENLFGTPAAGRRVRASMRLSPASISFESLRDWQFRDPQLAREGFSENLSDQQTTDEGRATFDLNLQRFERATYRVNLLVEGFEADGGRGVSGEATQLVSSLPFLVGWKADGRLDFIPRGSTRNIELIAVDSQLARVAAPGLVLKRLERRYVSVLLKQNNGIFKYESRLKEVALDERPMALPGGNTTLAVDATTPGDFSYLVVDASGQVYARVDYTIAGAANLSRSMEKNAELQIVLERQDYAPGATIRMQIQAPYTGTGLITIEKDRVYAWRWFRTTTNSSVQEIQVPQGLEGNGYVSVSFVRDPASEEVYTAPLSFGVRPFSIALDARRNAVTLRAAAQVKPGEDLAIAYRTERPARVALFAVDEGILQVARYRTPDPLSHFFRKRSLDVSTRQILDLILPGFRESMLAAPGGDESALLGANLNPFRRKTDAPVAWWAGIVDAGTDERTLRWQVPDYFNGRVRIMAVAVNESAIGTAERTAIVRGDFVLSPNAPLTAAPGDEFDVSVGVANNIESSGTDAAVEVSLAGSPQLQVLGASSQTLKIAAMRESSARFRVRALETLGSGSLQFRAQLGTRGARQTATVSVRPAVAYMTTLSAGSFSGSAKVDMTRNMYPQFRTLEASVSSLPLALAHGLVSYLNHYPYSCTEQLVSQAMPAIVLSRRPEFGELRANEGATLETMIDELRSRQNGDGSFRYWAGGVESHDFVSVYAQHVLLEANERGLPVPADILQDGRQFLLRMARRDGDNLEDERTSAYALYLLARQGTVVANEAAALQSRLQERYAREWPADIVAAYLAAAYQLMRQQTLADRAIAAVAFDNAASPGRWYGSMSRDGVLLYLLSRHFPQRLARLPANVLENLVKNVQAQNYNSLSAATTILALDAYATASASNGGQELGIETTLADRSRQALALPEGLFPKVEFPAATRSLGFSSEGNLRAFYLVDESGFDRTPPTQATAQSLEVTRDLLGADGGPVTSVKLGEEVTVRVRFRAIGRSSIDDAVLVDLLPGGFDLVVPTAPPADQPFLSAMSGEESGDGERRARGSGCPCLWLATRPGGFPDFADLREDRVVVYGRATDSIQEYSYRIKATNVGSYIVPGAFGISMYESQVRARSVAGRISVER